MPIIQTSKQLTPRDPHDHYPTDERIAIAAIRQIPDLHILGTPLICDAGAGGGAWGKAVRHFFPSVRLHGIELRDIETPTDNHGNPIYDLFIADQNYATYKHEGKLFDLHIGNPAYGDLFNETEKARKRQCVKDGTPFVKRLRPADLPFFDAEMWVRKAISETRPGGWVVFLLRLAFLESIKRARGLWKEYPPTKVLTLASRPSFTLNGKTNSDAYAIFYWHVGNFDHSGYVGGWLDWSNGNGKK